MSRVLHRCMAKLNRTGDPAVEHSLGWVTSQRGTLRVMTDALEFKDHKIPYSEIDEATLVSTSQMFIPCYLLLVVSKNHTYQFGLNPGSFWKRELPFPVKRVARRLGYSWFSLVVRLLAVALLGRLVWRLISPYFFTG